MTGPYGHGHSKGSEGKHSVLKLSENSPITITLMYYGKPVYGKPVQGLDVPKNY